MGKEVRKMPNEKDNRARNSAVAALREIVSQVERLEHARECSGDENCEATDAAIFAGVNLHYDGTREPTAEEREEYHNEESARQDIQESSYGTEVRSDWVTPGHDFEASEYTILLAGGGPALRIIGDLDNGTPDTARLEYQDWFTPWEEYLVEEEEDREALLKFASEDYFG
jgi:hypothetical protein